VSAHPSIQNKIPVTILGATGCVGQKFIQLLQDHPWFKIVALCASERSAGKSYGEVVNWLMPMPLPAAIAAMQVISCDPSLSDSFLSDSSSNPLKIAFSGLDSSVAGAIEVQFAQAGYTVFSNAGNHRMDADVPLIIPEVNPDHFELLKFQKYLPGSIITNPNCSVIGLVLALKPIFDSFGIESAHITTLQAISGAGYPGVPSLDIIDNIIPHILGEEDKLEREPLKILGSYTQGHLSPAALKISAHCNRVPVTEGHLACVSIKLKTSATPNQIIAAWREFQGEPQRLKLPSAPRSPVNYLDHPYHPQPKIHRDSERGMQVSVGRLRLCPLMDYKFMVLSHNTVRGAAGTSILNAELFVKTALA
jgi:aspartate-semialdehyde dehydrogenase